MLAAVTLGVVACQEAVAPLMPAGAQSIKPLPVYERWWTMTEQCSGLTGNFDHVLWYTVPGASSFSFRNLRDVRAIWMEDDRIILAGDAARDGQLVRHQMLHALMQEGHHTRERFVGTCGGMVECAELCLDDAGPPPPPDAFSVNVDPSALEVTVTSFPESPGSDILGGYVEVVVTARNPSDRAVTVRLPDPPSGVQDASNGGDDEADAGRTFRYSFASSAGARFFDDRARALEATRFKPGEVKRRVFEFWVGGTSSQAPLQPGDYRLHGAYADHWASVPLSVLVRK